MERGGISLRLVRFVHALVGHLRGGLLHVMVLSMYLVSGLSGSKTADVAAVGSVMRDMLEQEGYDVSEGTAVLAASAAMGETVPPSIAMLVLGSITTLSMAALFIGGIIPAAVVAICLMALIWLRSRRANAPVSRRAPVRTMVASGIAAILPLLMPVILFAGILLGIATPTGTIALLIVVGSVLEGLPALIILAPLLLPIAGGIGLSELHYGIVLLIAMGAGAFLPPAGVGFYVACAIMRTDIESASRAMVPYLVVLIIALLIVAFVPWFTVFLPRALGLGG
jgi:TRAP-type C4-dicarboxylate transport system permease large subunit